MYGCIDREWQASTILAIVLNHYFQRTTPALSFSLHAPPFWAIASLTQCLTQTKISQYRMAQNLALLALENCFVLRAVAPRSCANQAV